MVPTVNRVLGRPAMRILMLLIYFCCMGLTMAEEISTDSAESYNKEELTFRAGNIIRQRCFECHGPNKQKADLRLDQQKYLTQPLSSGGSLLHTDPEQSELYQRITSSDPDFRMPTNRDPLPVEEIEILKRWLEAGSPSYISKPKIWEILLESWVSWGTSMQPIAAPIAALLFLWLILGRLARSKHIEVQGDHHGWRLLIHWLHSRPELFVLLALTLGFWQKAQIAVQSEKKALEQINKHKLRRAFGVLPRPQHPPRLGGTYYRGNDERNPELFNQGFYCTCIFEIYLAQDNRRLKWGDPVSENAPLKIVVEIKRAPHATPRLFDDKRMTSNVITEWNAYENGNMPPEAIRKSAVPFTTLESGEHWIAEHSLESSSLTASGTLVGKLYIAQSVQGNPHYGVSYSIKIENNAISEESEIWMGAMYFTANVVVPGEREIPLSQWFDFRPMPMIEGGNSNDPKLLGINEHLDSEAKGKEPAKEK